MWENIVEPGRPHDDKAHAHCMLDTSGYKQNMQCSVFFSETVVARTRFSVTLYVYCPFFFCNGNVVFTLCYELNLLITGRYRGSGCCSWSFTS